MAKHYNAKKEQEQFTQYHLSQLPKHWRFDVESEFLERFKKDGDFAANTWLREITDPLDNLLKIAADDDDIKELSKQNAWKVREKATHLNRGEFYAWCKMFCEQWACRYPDEHDNEQIRARLIDDVWWLRQLRVAHARAREICAIDAGLVHGKKNLYVSDDTLDRRKQQKRRNANTLQNITMVSESGERMQLKDIADAGNANPDNKRAELMTRVAGFEDLSIKYGHHALFVTVTCPSKMHATLKSGKPNPKYDGTKPHEAQKYLVKTWAQVRAKLHRDGLRCYGLRVSEPHHDATPHWHLILFFNPNDRGMFGIEPELHLRKVINDYFLAMDGDERGAKKNRVTFVSINPLKGTAAGYVAKYVAKNIGGIEGEQSDEADVSSADASERVEAWATTWRIRQFQQIGGHYVTVWRELRRVNEDDAKVYPQIFKGWQAAQKTEDKKASFADFIESMGGLNVSPRESVLKVHDDYVTKRGRYGESIVRVVLGICERWGLATAKTNREKWERVA